MADPRPDFNEYAVGSSSNQDRVGTKIDLFLLHPGRPGNADSLARFPPAPPIRVSYHYTVGEGRATTA